MAKVKKIGVLNALEIDVIARILIKNLLRSG